MRIQHNIMAMNAYRNYNTNTSALSKNLEKLSSGYKINRAGDDAAGLAISEKMRAQITGLNAASKNVKDGISLVKTAEGAMQEIQDMLNRMDYLATQSANGTYDNEVDRAALQKEVDQLKSEINRIADSANFNGIKLLDGSLDADGVATAVSGADRIISSVWDGTGDPTNKTGEVTFLDGAEPTKAVNTVFEVDFADLVPTAGAGGGGGAATGTKAVYSFDLTGKNVGDVGTKQIDGVTITAGADLNATMTDFVTTYNGTTGKNYDAAWDAANNKLTLTAKAEGAVAAGPTTDINGVAANEDVAGADAPAAGAGTPATAAKVDVALTYNNAPTWGNTDQVVFTSTGGGTNLNMTASFDGTNWTVTGAPTGWTATFDGNNLTITSDTTGETGDANHDFGTIAAAVTCNATAGVTATAADTFTDGADATPGGAAGGDDPVGSFKINGKAYADIDLTGVTTTQGVAEKVFTELGGTVGTKLEDLNLFGDGTLYDVEQNGSKLTFTLKSDPTEDNIKGNFDWDMTATAGNFKGNHTAGTNVVTAGSVESAGVRANTVFKITTDDLKDGTKITLDGKTVTLAVGPNSSVKDGEGVVKLTTAEAADLNLALGKISEAFGGETDNFTVSVNNTGNGDAHAGLAIYKKADSENTYTTKEQLAGVFSMSVASSDADKGTALKLQIGDTSDDYNQLNVSIGDMHTSAMGIANLSIAKQDDAANAIQTIRNAINYVSGVRGDLGATQNRLEHTANNLSVMAENIQDAESTIRDTDVAEEMMSYVKNNILVQSAQAMLAQANQVPQGVLQLLG